MLLSGFFLGLAVLGFGGYGPGIYSGRIWEVWELSEILGRALFAKQIISALYNVVLRFYVDLKSSVCIARLVPIDPIQYFHHD
jgi:hypothetical protein